MIPALITISGPGYWETRRRLGTKNLRKPSATPLRPHNSCLLRSIWLPARYQRASCTLAVYALLAYITRRVLVSLEPQPDSSLSYIRSTTVCCIPQPNMPSIHVNIQSCCTNPRFPVINLTHREMYHTRSKLLILIG